MSADSRSKHAQFLKLVALAFVVGFALAVALCTVWRNQPNVFTPPVRVAAVVVCPPFLLAEVLEATSDTTLALIITIGTIVFANAFLYAGLASFVYFLISILFPRRRA